MHHIVEQAIGFLEVFLRERWGILSKLRSLARENIPPEFRQFLRRKFRRAATFDDSFGDWASAKEAAIGYDSEIIAQRVLEGITAVRDGSVAYERDSVTFTQLEYSWPVLAGLMWAAASDGGVLRVLDFGGSLGSTFFQYRRFLGTLTEVSWTVVEQDTFVEIGRESVVETGLAFCDSIPNALATGQPNFVHFGSSLQYLENPREVLEAVAQTGAKYLLLDRIPVSELDRDLVTVQMVPPSIYPASYAAWVFSLEGLKRTLEIEWDVVSEFESLGGQALTTSGVCVSWRGMLCSRKMVK